MRPTEFGPGWTFDQVLNLTYPQILILASEGKPPKPKGQSVARNKDQFREMVERANREQGIAGHG